MAVALAVPICTLIMEVSVRVCAHILETFLQGEQAPWVTACRYRLFPLIYGRSGFSDSHHSLCYTFSSLDKSADILLPLYLRPHVSVAAA